MPRGITFVQPSLKRTVSGATLVLVHLYCQSRNAFAEEDVQDVKRYKDKEQADWIRPMRATHLFESVEVLPSAITSDTTIFSTLADQACVYTPAHTYSTTARCFSTLHKTRFKVKGVYIRTTMGRKEKGNKSVHPGQNYVQVKEGSAQVPRKRKEGSRCPSGRYDAPDLLLQQRSERRPPLFMALHPPSRLSFCLAV